MIALEIKGTKNIMNALLLSGQFDSFLVEEAVITTFSTFHIDGHLVRDFYDAGELEELENDGFSVSVTIREKNTRFLQSYPSRRAADSRKNSCKSRVRSCSQPDPVPRPQYPL